MEFYLCSQVLFPRLVFSVLAVILKGNWVELTFAEISGIVYRDRANKLANTQKLNCASTLTIPEVFAKDNSAGNCFKLVSSSLIFLMFTCCFFFAEMVDDWTMNYRPDLLTFVPYEWSFNIILRDFEMVWLGNQHNWIECASNRQENGMFQTC